MEGLSGCEYLDSLQGRASVTDEDASVSFAGEPEVDRIYLSAAPEVVFVAGGGEPRVRVKHEGLPDLVVSEGRRGGRRWQGDSALEAIPLSFSRGVPPPPCDQRLFPVWMAPRLQSMYLHPPRCRHARCLIEGGGVAFPPPSFSWSYGIPSPLAACVHWRAAGREEHSLSLLGWTKGFDPPPPPDSQVWNPSKEKAGKMADLSSYQHFVCLEPALARALMRVAPGSTWHGSQTLQLEAAEGEGGGGGGGEAASASAA